jgi:ABC-2 type transport system permease protein
MITVLSITWYMWLAAFKSQLQYRANFIMMIMMGFVVQSTGFAFIWVVLTRFESVAGWSLGEVAFLYGLRLVMHAIAGLFSAPVWDLEWKVRQGDFDRYLVRPLPPLLQLICEFFGASAFGDLLGGLAMLIAAQFLVGIQWSAGSIVFLTLALVGGALIEAALRFLLAALSFRTLSSASFLSLLDTIMSNFGNYPLRIFGNVLEYMLTFGLPLAFMAYFPAVVLLERTGELIVHPWFAYGAPLAGVLWMALAVVVFQSETRQYKSSGN